MLKNASFFGKKLEKLPQRWGLRPQTPVASGGWGLHPQTTKLLLSLNLRVTFEH